MSNERVPAVRVARNAQILKNVHERASVNATTIIKAKIPIFICK
jgi:hypothetical protein